MNRFKALRQEKHLTQDELIEQFDARYGKRYAPASLSMFETGKRIPHMNQLMNFADFFDVSVEYLLGKDSERKKKSRVIPKQLEKILNEEVLTYNGELITEDDREKIRRLLEIAFWDAKKKNKKA